MLPLVISLNSPPFNPYLIRSILEAEEFNYFLQQPSYALCFMLYHRVLLNCFLCFIIFPGQTRFCCSHVELAFPFCQQVQCEMYFCFLGLPLKEAPWKWSQTFQASPFVTIYYMLMKANGYLIVILFSLLFFFSSRLPPICRGMC